MRVIETQERPEERLRGGLATAAWPHPDPGVLRRFTRGDVTKAEGKEIVAHLLSRCGSCAARVREAAWLPEPRQESPDHR